MAFIGNSVQTQGFTPAVDYFSGNGVTVTFTLSRPVVSVAQMIVVIDNVPQNPSSAYTVAGNAITFTSAPLAGTNNIWVEYTSLITTYAAISQSPSVIGDITTSGGFLANGNFGNTYLDGTVVDYVTGNGRITTGPADGFTIYNGGTSARYALASWDATGNLTAPQAIKLSYSSNSNYASDAAISNYASNNGVYVNGNAAGWLRLNADGTNSTYIQCLGSSYSTPNQIEFNTAGNQRMAIQAGGYLKISSGLPIVNSAGRAMVNQTGGVLQVVSTTKSDTWSYSQPNWVDITGLSVTITPSSTSSKILVMAVVNYTTNSGGASSGYRLVRNSTPISIADAAGSRPQFSSSNQDGYINSSTIMTSPCTYLDSPASSSAITYKVQAFGNYGSNVWYCNYASTNRDSSQYDAHTVSSITVMEIAG